MPTFSPKTRDLIKRTEALVAQYPDSEVYEVPEDGNYDFRCTNQGLLGAQVCSRKSGQEAAEWLTTVRPPGTSYNKWVLSDDVAPVTCSQFPATHQHFIVEC